MSLAQIEALYTAAVDALEAGNYDLAITKALACKMRLAATPNIERVLAGGGTQRLEWANAVALDSFITQCKQLKASTAAAAGGPFQTTKITYARPDRVDSF